MTTKRRRKATGAGTAGDAPSPGAGGSATASPATPAGAADACVRLGASLRIRTVDVTAAELRAALAAGRLRLDGGEVAQVDTAGLQLLIAAIASARAAGVGVEWLAGSSALADAARRLGVGALLELPANG